MYKPSDLVPHMGPTLLLPSAYGKAVLEQAAALLIHFRAENGDNWNATEPAEMRAFIQSKDSDPNWRILRNPFFRPDIAGLVESPYAVKNIDLSVKLTPLGIMRAAASLKLAIRMIVISLKGGSYIVEELLTPSGTKSLGTEAPEYSKTILTTSSLEAARAVIPAGSLQLPDDPDLVEGWML